MPRNARFKLEDGGFYHLCARAAARHGEFPLAVPVVRHKLLELIQHYANAYFCKFAAVSVLGNHWHGVCRFDRPRKLSHKELKDRAQILYPRSEKQLARWTKPKWERLQDRLFDVSEFMRNVQGAFSRWYNRTYNRKGHFWGERFCSTILGGPESVLEAILYVELNAVRAGLETHPEDYEGGSLYLREAGKDHWLMPLSEILYDEKGTKDELHARFKELIYYRGAIVTKMGQRPIPDEVIKRERARGFRKRGAFRKRVACFTNGLVLGGELYVLEKLTKLRKAGQYLRRKNPVEQLDGVLFSLREQRSNYIQA
jgi:putative transposase